MRKYLLFLLLTALTVGVSASSASATQAPTRDQVCSNDESPDWLWEKFDCDNWEDPNPEPDDPEVTPPPVVQIIERPCTCQNGVLSRRIYTWTITYRYWALGSRHNGQRIVSAKYYYRNYLGQLHEGTAVKFKSRGKTRLRATADFRNRRVSRFGTTVHIAVRARLANGVRVWLDEEVTLGTASEGHPNAPSSSSPSDS